jgi:hypothetical protein
MKTFLRILFLPIGVVLFVMSFGGYLISVGIDALLDLYDV